MKNHIIVCSMFLLLSSCVSVGLPGKKVVSAKNVEYTEPASPFKNINMVNVDKAWLSGKTANTISYFSECGNDPSLQTIENDILGAMNNVEIIKTEDTTFSGRAALKTIASGDVDGVPVKMSVLVFKKNGCSFTLSYGGTADQFTAEEAIFEKFKTSFRAP